MPPLEQCDLTDTVVLWAKSSVDSSGRVTVSAPSEIDARIVRSENETLDPQNENVPVDAQLITAQAIAIGSLVWEGELTDWYSSGSAGQSVGLLQVTRRSITRSIKGDETRYEFGLTKFKGRYLTRE